MAKTDKTKSAEQVQEPRTAAEMLQMRKKRNLWLIGLIFGLAVLFYFITILRMAS